MLLKAKYLGATHDAHRIHLKGEAEPLWVPKHDAVTLDITAGNLAVNEVIDIEIADWWLAEKGIA